MLEANVTNLKTITTRKYPGGYGAKILQELSADISNCWSLKKRSTCDALCSVIVKIITKFIASHYQDAFSCCVPGSKDHSWLLSWGVVYYSLSFFVNKNDKPKLGSGWENCWHVITGICFFGSVSYFESLHCLRSYCGFIIFCSCTENNVLMVLHNTSYYFPFYAAWKLFHIHLWSPWLHHPMRLVEYGGTSVTTHWTVEDQRCKEATCFAQSRTLSKPEFEPWPDIKSLLPVKRTRSPSTGHVSDLVFPLNW